MEPASALGGAPGSAVKSFKPNGGGGIMGDVEMPSAHDNYSQYNRSAPLSSQQAYDKEMVDMHMTLGQKIKV